MYCVRALSLLIPLLYFSGSSLSSEPRALAAVTDRTSYNAGSLVRLRLLSKTVVHASIRYAGESAATIEKVFPQGIDYQEFWTIPWNARTGRYQVDITDSSGKLHANAASFAVHRQLAKVVSLELDKTFYTSGDSVNPYITVRNVSNTPLDHLRVEFESYNYPWIAPAPDETPQWNTTVAEELSLAPGEEKEFRLQKAAVARAEKEPLVLYYAVVIRDSRKLERIYDLAFAPPAFTATLDSSFPKQYPFLYLYPRLADVKKASAYRQFYPPSFVSEAIKFETAHTMFAEDTQPVTTFKLIAISDFNKADVSLHAALLNGKGATIEEQNPTPSWTNPIGLRWKSLPAGNYTAKVSLRTREGAPVATNQLEFAVNRLPRSILVFCAHQDDDTAHPGLIRAATENKIPIHFVYLTGGDAGGCDRYYMHSCDAARAMDFGEVRMEEARASLASLGVPRDDISFLGLPDGGLEQIWYEHVTPEDPYLSVLLASDHSPYQDAATPNLPFARDPVVAAVKEYIRRFRPDLIITGHPDERHVDHRTNNWIVVKAMQELQKEGALPSDTQLIVDQVYGAMPGRHAPYRYEKQRFYISGEVSRMAQEALWFYQSQDGNHEQASIVPFDKLSRQEPYPHFRILDWNEHQGWNEKR